MQGQSRGHLFLLEEISTFSSTGITLLNNLSFSISRGEWVLFSGERAAGKSQVIHLLAGRRPFKKGRFLRSDDIGKAPLLIPDQIFLQAELKLEDHLILNYSSRRHKNVKAFYKELKELLDFFGLGGKLQTKISQLSRAEQRIVQFIASLLVVEGVILVDDLDAFLDEKTLERLFELLDFYNRNRGLTVIASTSRLEVAKKCPGRVIYLESGKIVYSGHACFI